MSANHVMVDIETLDVLPTALILSIGAVSFDPMSNKAEETFYTEISVQDCLDCGLSTNIGTISWWMKQSPEAQTVLKAARKSTTSLDTALCDLSSWWKEHKLKYIWGNGAGFDAPILSHAYSKTSQVQPWQCWDELCFRTMKNLNDVEPPVRQGVYHNALADAEFQVEYLQKIFKEAYD